MKKSTPQFTWYRMGTGAERWHNDTREKSASMLRTWRNDARISIEILGRGYYRITRDNVMALLRTK